MSGQQWWRRAVVYQVWPRSFSDADGDGVGDLRGVVDRLDHLAHLGVDALWLSPVYPSPQVDAGYDISDYQGVDPLFGSLADLDALVAGLHARGMRLVLDVVVNHTSDQHPWFLASRSSRDDPHRDWYYWAEQPPNAWRAMFGGPAWQPDAATGEQYLHTFAPEQPDLRWESADVRAAVAAMLRWWLDRGVDGFRFDVISMIGKDLGDPHGVLGFAPSLHEHLQELHREVLAGRELLTVGETPGASVEQGRLITDPARGELDMLFQFEHVSLDRGRDKWDAVPLPLPALKQNLARWQEGVGDGWNALYWDNHDQPRAVSRFGDDGVHRVASAKTLATVLHLHRGTPFVYQGEELGLPNPSFGGIGDYRDVESRNHYAEAVAAGEPEAEVLADLQRSSRDNARTPVPWDDGPSAGFTAGTPWMAVAPNHVGLDAAAQRADPDSVLAHYRRLVALRHDVAVVVDGAFALLLPDDPRVWAFTRTGEDAQLLVVANCSADEVVPDLPDWTAGTLLLGTHAHEGAVLRPWESRVYRTR